MQQKSAISELTAKMRIFALAAVTISMTWYLILTVTNMAEIKETVNVSRADLMQELKKNYNLIQLNSQHLVQLNKSINEIEEIIRKNESGKTDTKRIR